MNTNMVRQSLLKKLEQLPDSQLSNVLSYVSFLIHQQKQPTETIAQQSADPAMTIDPLANFIGSVSYEPITNDIDADVYE